jgi:hypothetical protein
VLYLRLADREIIIEIKKLFDFSHNNDTLESFVLTQGIYKQKCFDYKLKICKKCLASTRKFCFCSNFYSKNVAKGVPCQNIGIVLPQ